MRGRRTFWVALVAAVALTAVVVGSVVGLRPSGPDRSGSTSTGPAPEPDPEPTTLAAYDTADVAVVRGPFCDRVSPTGIEHALGDVPADSETWDNGDRERLPDGSRDRVQEHGCRWTAADGTRAAAWVFVPPVTAADARALRRERPARDCRSVPGDPFGRAGVTWACRTDGATEARYAGRFGDAWLTCSLTATGPRDDELDRRASEWCVAVVEAARS